MRIAYLTHEYPPDTGKGGIGTYTWQMATIMRGRGHEVSVFTASFEREVKEKDQGVEVHRVRIQQIQDFPLAILPVFAKVHQNYPFDVLECPEIGGEAIEIVKHFPQLPLIVRLHTPAVLVTRLQNTYVPLTNKLRFVLGSLLRGKLDLGYWSKQDKNQYSDPDYLITEKAKLITAPSKAMKQWAVDFWRIPADNIRIIPNPYEPSTELLDIEHQEEHKRITFLGRLNVLKGLVSLTKAVPRVLKKHPDWQFRFIGNTQEAHLPGMSMKEWMEQQLANYQHNIEFIDWLEYSELPGQLAESDIVVIPSLFESFSYVCAEAMSAGCAVVGSNRSAMRELLDNNQYGLLVNPKSSRAIANAIIQLIEKPGLRRHLGTKARTQVLEAYNATKIGALTESHYRKIITEV